MMTLGNFYCSGNTNQVQGTEVQKLTSLQWRQK